MPNHHEKILFQYNRQKQCHFEDGTAIKKMVLLQISSFVYFQNTLISGIAFVFKNIRYLTCWTLYSQIAVTPLSVAVVLTGCERMTALRDYLHAGIAFPFGLTGCVATLGVMVINPEALASRKLQDMFPPHLGMIKKICYL